MKVVVGIDLGSTTTKAVLLDEHGTLLTKQYQLSKGNPIADTRELLAKIKAFVHDQGATLEVLGFGATGYAADVLEESLRADVNIVETVAHMMAAVKYCGDVDVICDVGGQDIKIIILKHGRVKVSVSLAKGKKEYDKRETIKRRETDRETRAAIKSKR